MPATIHFLQVSKHGAPLLVVFAEQSRVVKITFQAFVVWPEAGVDGGFKEFDELSVRFQGVGEAAVSRTLSVARLALKEAVLQFAAGEAAKIAHPVEALALASVDDEKLVAWRSLGLYKGLDNRRVYESALEVLRVLDGPYDLRQQ